ncbi:uncharacterized protein [Coffea arabica]|uniref:Uncharacterized protein isoform X2 n=1 Tax=Coffea arabica TaxID=13443 RepID=A0A6P6T5Z6_COFAR|nr:uncharacterized protein LOC113697879 [Coffea arabica]
MVERMMEIEDELMMILMEVSTFFHGSRCFTGNINLYRPCSISGYDQWKICESYAHCNSYDPMDERHLGFSFVAHYPAMICTFLRQAIKKEDYLQKVCLENFASALEEMLDTPLYQTIAQ